MFPKLFHRIRHPLMANSFYLYLSYFSDYIFALIILPFIARTLGAEEFGKIGLAQTFSIFIILFMEFGFPLMATRRVAREKNNLTKIKLFISQVTTFKLFLIPIVIFISIVIVMIIPSFYSNPHYIMIVTVGAVSQGLAPSWYFQGIEKMRKIALSKTIFRLIGLIIILLFVKSSNEGWIVLASYTLSSTLICIYLFMEMIKSIGKFSLAVPSKAINILNKSKYSFLITILPIVYQNASMILLSIFVNPVELGFYYGINRIYLGFNSLYSPIGQAFFPRLSSVYYEDKIKSKKLTINFFWVMNILGLTFFAIIFFFSDQIIVFLLGKAYLSGSNALKLFGIVLVLTAVSHVLGRQWFMIRGKDRYYSLIQFVSSIGGFISFLYMVDNYGIISIPISFIVFELISIFMILFFIKNEYSKIFKN